MVLDKPEMASADSLASSLQEIKTFAVERTDVNC